jgi:lycopene cyclase domain-containing protein
MRSFQYLIVLGLCLAATLPLELVLGARVWRRPRRLAKAVLPPLAVFLAWDLWAAADGQWSFNPALTTDVRLPYGVPVDEVLFFVVVPICGLLTLEAVRSLRRRGWGKGR